MTFRFGSFTLDFQSRALLRDGRPVPLSPKAFKLVWIDAQSVSRRHARLMVAPGLATLEDLGSKNGTFVNGIRLTAPVALRDGDELRIGNVPMTLKIHARPGSTETVTGH